ncbi:MAG: hypothetical protein AB7V42_05420 [Thermoleophilia bacterium]
MTPPDEASAAQPASAPPPSKWRRNALAGVVALVVVVLAYLIGAAVLPRWWAQRIGDQVDGSLTAGTGIGLFYGFVFTALPLLALWPIFHRGRSWKLRGWLFLGAVILAIPNLLTLGIVTGNSSSAHAGERILDVDGPNFRAFTLVGALIAVAAVAGARYLVASRRRGKRREKGLRDELKARDEAARQAAGKDDPG